MKKYIYLVIILLILIIFSSKLSYASVVKPTNKPNICNDLLLNVNKVHALQSNYVPKDLVNLDENDIPNTDKNIELSYVVIKPLKRLIEDAKEEGISIKVISGYRSYEDQQNIVNEDNVELGSEKASIVSAPPGHSQHQLGTAVDFTSDQVTSGGVYTFGQSDASKWLQENAYKYGFIMSYPKGSEDITGYQYEPWHYRYIGEDYSWDLINKNIILEKYLGIYGKIPSC